jgi:2-polyprenyl-3-methyl-5-hydroxy-6-metoxy-1,4-benzoquinol methylase
MATVDDVRNYWNEHPLFSHELAEPGSRRYFDQLDRIKVDDVERFAFDYWDFDACRGKRVLDVGCGPGWLTVQYARAGAHVTAVDLTPRAVELTKKHLEYRGLSATVQEGNAECLAFPDGEFDVVVSSGVLHHTPDTPRAIRECWRVLRPGGTSKLTFYYKGILHSRVVFPLTRAVMRAAGVKHPGADLAKQAEDVDSFIRQYDGAQNPVGVGYTIAEWKEMLREAGFTVVGHQRHFFPRRFIPFPAFVPRVVHHVLDASVGTMVYFTLKKDA